MSSCGLYLPISATQPLSHRILTNKNRKRHIPCAYMNNNIVAEYFFDILLQDYINSLKAFYHRSQFSASESIIDGIYAKWPSTQKGNTR